MTTTTKTTTPQPIMWTFERALQHASCYVIENDAVGWTAERVARKMVEEGCGTWHGAHLVYLDRIASGEQEMPPCEYCGGPTEPRQGGHHSLCKVRAERGVPVERLDSTQLCYCYPCSQARGGR